MSSAASSLGGDKQGLPKGHDVRPITKAAPEAGHPAQGSSAATPLSHSQERALACLRANYGEAGEDTIALEGLNNVRATMKSLERRGLVVRGEYEATTGYGWSLA